MKKIQIAVNRKELEKELAIAKKVIAGKHNLQIIENIVLSFMPDSLAIQSTNLEHSYLGVIGKPINRKYRLPGKSQKVLVSIDRITRVIKSIPKKTTEIPLEITWNGGGLLVNGTTTIVAGGQYDDFPTLPGLPWGRSHNLLSCDKIEQVNSIPASDDKRAHIISLYVNGPAGHLVSTDGSRLYIANIPKAADMKPFLLPKKTASILTSPQLKNEIGNVRITDSYAFIETDHGFMCVRIPDGEFPDYNRIMPGHDPVAIISTPDKQDLIDIMSEAAAILNQNYAGVVFSSDNNLIITATNPDCGEYRKDISAEFTHDGAGFEMAFNQAFVVDACKSIQDKGLNMNIWGNEYPAAFESASGDFKALLMPMRI